MTDDVPLPGLFTCARHPGDLQITPATCAGLWARARRSPEDALVRLAPCVGCQIGAGHAGAPVSTRSAPCGSGAAFCARCGGGSARRLIGGRLCMNCYNRGREAQVGRNARGGPPTHHRPLFCAVVGVVGDDGVMNIEKIVRQAQIDVPGSSAERAEAMSNTLGIPRHVYLALEKVITDAQAKGQTAQQADLEKILTEYGGNQGADTVRLLTGVHNALTLAGSPVLGPLNTIASATEFLAGLAGYRPAIEPPSVSGTIERSTLGEGSSIMRKAQQAMRRYSKETGVPYSLLDLTAQRESNYSPRAGLNTGHVGIMQLSDATAKRYGVTDRTDIDQSVRAAALYLRDNQKLLGRWDLAAGAYVSGEGGMQDYLAGKSSGVGPITQRRMAEAANLGLDPPRQVAGKFELNVTVDVPGRGKIARTIDVPVGVPQPSGRAAVSIP